MQLHKKNPFQTPFFWLSWKPVTMASGTSERAWGASSTLSFLPLESEREDLSLHVKKKCFTNLSKLWSGKGKKRCSFVDLIRKHTHTNQQQTYFIPGENLGATTNTNFFIPSLSPDSFLFAPAYSDLYCWTIIQYSRHTKIKWHTVPTAHMLTNIHTQTVPRLRQETVKVVLWPRAPGSQLNNSPRASTWQHCGPKQTNMQSHKHNNTKLRLTVRLTVSRFMRLCPLFPLKSWAGDFCALMGRAAT